VSLSGSLGNEPLTDTLRLLVNESSGRIGIVITVKYIASSCASHTSIAINTRYVNCQESTLLRYPYTSPFFRLYMMSQATGVQRKRKDPPTLHEEPPTKEHDDKASNDTVADENSSKQ